MKLITHDAYGAPGAAVVMGGYGIEAGIDEKFRVKVLLKFIWKLIVLVRCCGSPLHVFNSMVVVLLLCSVMSSPMRLSLVSLLLRFRCARKICIGK